MQKKPEKQIYQEATTAKSVHVYVYVKLKSTQGTVVECLLSKCKTWVQLSRKKRKEGGN